MGCHRSGTNLLYDTLLSAGGFAIYRGYLPVYKLLIPRFGSLDKLENREAMMATWIRSKGFRRSGLNAAELTTKILSDCRTGGDFLRIIMDEIAQQQNVKRWAVYDPDTVLQVPRIKADIPEALFVHIVRDGRDIALSLKKMGGFNPFPWDRSSRSLQETALYWEWMVRKGQEYGRKIPGDYFEIRYEDLISQPQNTLSALGKFLDHDLDYDRIQRTGLGSLSDSNSSFRDDETSRPLNRWQKKLSAREVTSLEKLVGSCLQELGYGLTTTKQTKPNLQTACIRAAYAALLDTKFWLKMKTPFGRLSNISVLELADTVSQSEAA
jgi:hypothetical protein